MNLFHVYVYDDYKEYERKWPNRKHGKNQYMLTKEEFDLLKEVFEYE